MNHAWHLHDEGDGLVSLVLDVPDKKLNVLTRAVLGELESTLDQLSRRTDIRALVLLSGKDSGFIAGADLEEIATIDDPVAAEAAARSGQRLYQSWSELPFPTIAAVDGICVGGGTELALASTFIVLADRDELRIGLPETKLGILPGWGGCTRLPRRIALPDALDIILGGKNLRPYKAFKIGLADALMPAASFRHHVRDFARRAADGEIERREPEGLKRFLLSGNALGRKIVFDKARKQVLSQTKGNYPAPLRAIEVIRVGLEEGPERGFDAEARAIGELIVSPVSKNLVHVFRLMEHGKKPQSEGTPRPVRSAAVVGAGVMGGGIAQILASEADVAVRLKDIHDDGLSQGIEHAAKLFHKAVQRRWISEPTAERKLSLLRPTLDYSGFGGTDVVIEAIVEKLAVKQSVFRELEAVTAPDTVLASNTSSLPIDAIAGDLTHPERVVGMHFFNPVHKMPLIEVIAGRRTNADAVATVAALTRRLGKTPVIVRDGPGFLVNRLLMFSMGEAMWLLDEGVPIEELDAAMTDWGMPMGPVTLTDEVGADVAVHVARFLAEAFSDRLEMPDWLDRLLDDGRLGVKAGKGFYRYDEGERRDPDPAAYELLGLEPGSANVGPSEIADRVVLPMVNEAARCLDEGVAGSAADVDLAMILGTGFPPFRGGLLHWADGEGPGQVVDRLDRLADTVAERFRAGDALRAVAAGGGFYARYPADRSAG